MATLHILALPLPLQGHINPLLHLLSRLSSPRCITTLLVPEESIPRIQRSLQGNSFVRLTPIPPSIFDVKRIADLPSAQQLFRVLALLEEAQNDLAQIVQSLRSETTSGLWAAPISCILADCFVHMAQDLANQLKLPRIGLWTASASSFLTSSSLPALISHGIVPSSGGSDLDLPVDCIPGIQNLHKRDLPSSILFPQPGQLEQRVKIFSRTREAACTLINTVEELEPTAIQDQACKFLAVGPLLPSSFLADEADDQRTVSHGEGLWKEDTDCLTWLDEQRPGSVLYISFGSMANLSLQQVEQLAAGIESSKQPFLWVIRPNLVAGGVFPEGFLESLSSRTRSQGLVIAWAPQLQVLKHVSLGGFLTHCGWNSTLEAISCGVPMLAWPCFAEQNLNCKFIVEEWKVGLRVNKLLDGSVTSAEVQRVVKLLAQVGQELKQRALQLRDKVRTSVTPSGSSSRNSNTFVDLLAARPN